MAGEGNSKCLKIISEKIEQIARSFLEKSQIITFVK